MGETPVEASSARIDLSAIRSRRAAPPLPRTLGALLEPAYRAIMARRNRRFDRGERVTDVGTPVISVGNLSVGGTGKTPMVQTIVRWLREGGRTPAIAMRGYKAARGGESDEQMEHGATLPGVPIVAQPRRVEGIAALRARRTDVDCVVLDDAFQHRFVRRDADIVLLDATRDPFDDRCLPAGWLREPVENLRRATAIVLTHAQDAGAQTDRLRARLASLLGEKGVLIAETDHAWTALLDEADQPIDCSALQGASVSALCGVGNPHPFLRAIERHGASLRFAAVTEDHARHDRRLARAALEAALEGGDDFVVTTEKDWVKLREHVRALREEPALREAPAVVRPRLELRFSEGEAALRRHVLEAAGARTP